MNNTIGKSTLFGKSRKYYAVIGLFILLIGVTHFSMQMSFIQKENLRAVETVAENEVIAAPPVKHVIEIEPEQIEVITIPDVVKRSEPRREKEIVPARNSKPVRKKEVRETRAERLRRAERILTGV